MNVKIKYVNDMFRILMVKIKENTKKLDENIENFQNKLEEK